MVAGSTQDRTFSFDCVQVIGDRARIGLVVLATDYTVEHEFRQVFTMPGVDFHVARIANDNSITPETLAAMKERIADTAALLLPGSRLDVIAYACTSASAVIGEDAVFAQINKAKPDTACSTPLTAAEAALNTLAARRIALLTPYRPDVNAVIRQQLARKGFDVVTSGTFAEEQDPVVAQISEASIESALKSLKENCTVDAVFVSCTSVRVLHCIERLEQSLGVPVVSSNSALAWHCLRLAGVEDQLSQLGKLFTL